MDWFTVSLIRVLFLDNNQNMSKLIAVLGSRYSCDILTSQTLRDNCCLFLSILYDLIIIRNEYHLMGLLRRPVRIVCMPSFPSFKPLTWASNWLMHLTSTSRGRLRVSFPWRGVNFTLISCLDNKHKNCSVQLHPLLSSLPPPSGT